MISVVITTYNRPNLLIRCVESLLKQKIEGLSIELIIVDDCSEKRNSDQVSLFLLQYPFIKYVRNDQNRGLSKSRNIGASITNGKYLLFLDDDIIVEQDYVLGHYQLLSKSTNVATVGSLRYPLKETKINNLMRYLSSRELRQRNLPNHFLSNLEPYNFGGGICGMSTEIFKFIGGFNEQFIFYGCEDLDMGYMLKKHGIRITYSPNSKADHHDNVTFDRIKNKYKEAAKNGSRLMISRDKDFYKNTSYEFIFPIIKGDSLKIRFFKYFYGTIINPMTEITLRNILSLTNHYSFLYFSNLFKLLVACWYYDGIRDTREIFKSKVKYE